MTFDTIKYLTFIYVFIYAFGVFCKFNGFTKHWFTNILCFFFVYLIILLFIYLFELIIYNSYVFKYKQNFIFYNIYSYILFFITIFFSFLCYIISFKKINKINSTYLYIYTYFIVVMFFFLNSNNIIYFFLFYELFLIPSVFLVFITSPNKKSLRVSIYFLLWTQLGSFLLLIGCVILINFHSIIYFSEFLTKNKFNNWNLLHFFILIGFLIKIPSWPFHFWLTKTHVEANTGFSIFLSGVLVKISLYGLYKFLPLYSKLNKFIFLFLAIISMIDSAIKLPFQTDLKKIVAYSTIFEMNYILLNVPFLNLKSLYTILLFLIFHSCISSLFFFIVDILYKNYNTRIVNSIKNIQRYNYTLAILLVLSLIFFTGIPLTIKFNLELFIINKIYIYNTYILILTLIVSFVFNFFIFKNFIVVLFGSSLKVFKILNLSLYENFFFLLVYSVLILINIV